MSVPTTNFPYSHFSLAELFENPLHTENKVHMISEFNLTLETIFSIYSRLEEFDSSCTRSTGRIAGNITWYGIITTNVA